MIHLIVYANDILVTGDDQCKIHDLERLLGKEFGIKDLGHLRYCLGIEVARPKKVSFILVQVCFGSSPRFWYVG